VYYGVCYKATMGHTMEQQWGMPGSNNGAYYEASREYYGAAMGPAMEQ